MCSNSRNTIATVEKISLQSITLRQPLNGNSGQLRTPILALGRHEAVGASWTLQKAARDHAELLTGVNLTLLNAATGRTVW